MSDNCKMVPLSKEGAVNCYKTVPESFQAAWWLNAGKLTLISHLFQHYIQNQII